ncbi:MAG: hypothetical protein FWE37_02120 [Spirochaetaceae bacterium]|nr:hypothetical protein [Spirochaetaceae bacterium]
MQLGVFFAFMLASNYLLVSFYGKSLLQTFKSNRLKSYLCVISIFGAWLVTALLSYGFAIFSNTMLSIGLALTPLFFSLVFMALMPILMLFFKWLQPNKYSDFAGWLLIFNSIMLSLTFLYSSNLLLIIAATLLTALAMLTAILLAIAIFRHFYLNQPPIAWRGAPIILIVTVLMLLALSNIGG